MFALLNKAAAYTAAVLISFIVLHLIPRRKTLFCLLGKHTLLIYLVHIFVLPMEFYLIRNVEFTGEKELNSAIILLILAVTICDNMLWSFYRTQVCVLKSGVYDKRGESF